MVELNEVIPPNEEREFQVEFWPIDETPAHRTVVVPSDSMGGPHTIELRGIGTMEVDPP